MIQHAWHFWYAVVLGVESGLRRLGHCVLHTLIGRYVFGQVAIKGSVMSKNTVVPKTSSRLLHRKLKVLIAVFVVAFIGLNLVATKYENESSTPFENRKSSSNAVLDINAKMDTWWLSGSVIQQNTVSKAVRDMYQQGSLNTKGDALNSISNGTLECMRLSTKDLIEINKTQSIGQTIVLCVSAMGYLR
ncbi:TPA: hypothetical protein ACGUON_001644 [Vibrio vulnificus]